MTYHESDDSGSIDLDLVGEDVHDMLQDIFNDSQINVVEVDEEQPPLTLEQIEALDNTAVEEDTDILTIENVSSQVSQPSHNKHILADSAIDDIDLSLHDDISAFENLDSLDLDSIDFEGGMHTINIKPPTAVDEEEYNYMNIDGDIKIDEEEEFNALGELVEFDPSEKKHQYIDEAIMTLLQPDYFKEIKINVKLDYVRNYNPVVKHWPVKLIKEEIIDIASKMSLVDCVSMYDAIGDENLKTKESYKLKECDLSEMKVVPKKYLHNRTESGMLAPMEEKEDEDGNYNLLRSQTFMKDGAKALNLGVEFGSKIGSKIGKSALSLGKNEKRTAKVICNGCGNRLKFSAKKKHKHHFMGYKCAKTKREYIFHDYVCAKLRRIKEAIRTYVLCKEREENPNMQIDEIESALINLDFDGNVKSDLRTRPIHSTTPRRGDFNYIQEEEDIENSEASSTNANSEFEIGLISSNSYNRSSLMINSRLSMKKLMLCSEVKHLPFRKYRAQVQRVSLRMESKRVYKNVPSYSERFSDLPEVLLYSDLSEFGVAVWEFVSESMKSKVRDCLWTVLEWLALEIPTNQVLSLLKVHTHLLSKHTLINYDKICKSTIEGSKYPIACTLRLSAFMYERSNTDLSNKKEFVKKGKQYVNVARKLLKEIESDHLFALLLMVPTDLGHQNVIDIALKYDLTEFLQDPRIVRVFKVISFNGYDFLDPRNSFQEPTISVDELFDRLWQNPGRFYFSPFGKFCIQSGLYIIYLALFSYVTYKKIYNYESADNIEIVLWLCSLGYVMNEVLEIYDTKQEYFSQMSNYIDILISLIWFGLAYLKFVHTSVLVFDDTGSIDEIATRNLGPTEIYMLLWGVMSILLWTRVTLLFTTSERAGPLIRIIMNMVNDVVNFSMIWGLFLIGGTFACYYVIAGDLADSEAQISSLASVAFYIFQTFIGQQDWNSVRSYRPSEDDDYIFDPWRSRIINFYMFIFAAMGTILLLNLLIAMMASSYQRVQDISFQQLSKQKVQTTYDLDTSRGAMPAPANIISYIFVVYWIAFEMMVYVLTFGHRQFNEEYFSPLNKEAHQYRKDDTVKFMKHGKKQRAIVERKIPLSERNLRRTNFRPQLSVDNIGIAPDECDLRVRWNSVPLELLDTQILKVTKPFFKHRESRCPTIDAENYYCRYCRYNLTDDSISIEYYLALFEKRGQHIDPEDKLYIKSLLALTDKYDIPLPKTMELCPNCFRPHRVYEDGSRDSLNRMMFILEIVSYMVFWLTLRWLALLLLFIPANIVKILKWMFKAFFETVGVVDTKSESQLNFSEENDDYRAKVRLVSKQEEKMENIVRRIDVNVKRLEDRLVGSMMEDEDAKEEDHILRSDEFNEEVGNMKNELMGRFDSIEKLLTSGGFGT